jgi:hypothetical protein
VLQDLRARELRAAAATGTGPCEIITMIGRRWLLLLQCLEGLRFAGAQVGGPGGPGGAPGGGPGGTPGGSGPGDTTPTPAPTPAPDPADGAARQQQQARTACVLLTEAHRHSPVDRPVVVGHQLAPTVLHRQMTSVTRLAVARLAVALAQQAAAAAAHALSHPARHRCLEMSPSPRSLAQTSAQGNSSQSVKTSLALSRLASPSSRTSSWRASDARMATTDTWLVASTRQWRSRWWRGSARSRCLGARVGWSCRAQRATTISHCWMSAAATRTSIISTSG